MWCGCRLLCCPVCLLQAVKVNSLGKWKTALQMSSMSMLLFCKDETGWMEQQLAGEGRRWAGSCTVGRQLCGLCPVAVFAFQDLLPPCQRHKVCRWLSAMRHRCALAACSMYAVGPTH